MEFKTKYNFDNSINSVAGTKTVNFSDYNKKDIDNGKVVEEYGYEYDYKEEYDKNGVRKLVIKGRHSVYDKIQSYKDDVDIYKILARYFNGDISVIDKNKGFYADITSIPKTFSEFHNKIVEGQNIYNGLPTDFKQMFGNDINQFMASIYDKSFDEKLLQYNMSKQKINNINVKNVDNNNNVKGDSNE